MKFYIIHFKTQFFKEEKSFLVQSKTPQEGREIIIDGDVWVSKRDEWRYEEAQPLTGEWRAQFKTGWRTFSYMGDTPEEEYQMASKDTFILPYKVQYFSKKMQREL